MATQSLPSFAQAFSSPSLSNISTGSKLAPIKSQKVPPSLSTSPPPTRHDSTRHPSEEDNQISPATGTRKRPRRDRQDDTVRDAEASGSDQSPRIVPVDHDRDSPVGSPPPAKVARLSEHSDIPDYGALPDTPCTTTSNTSTSPTRKRRVTISGTPNPLLSDARQAPGEPINLPSISPNVMGRDESAISTKQSQQQQQARLEQRKGSHPGINNDPLHSGAVPCHNGPESSAMSPALVTDDRHVPSKSTPAVRPTRRSPTTVSSPVNSRRVPSNAPVPGPTVPSSARPPSPNILVVPSQASQVGPAAPPSAALMSMLTAPPISFGRRRAGQLGQGKKKPADIVISPREAHTPEQLQPSIHSAPPVPQGGQSQFYSGRFAMTIPRLPSVMTGGDSVRRGPKAQVPPTPTRFTSFRNSPAAAGPVVGSSASASAAPGVPHLGPPPAVIARRSPPASVPISTTLVPPTPSALQQPGYGVDKAAFLSLFEQFYDALDGSKALKSWLGEQLHRSNVLMQTLSQQQERMDEVVESLVEKKTSGMRMEMHSLRRRIEELEAALRFSNNRSEASTRRQSATTPVMGPAPEPGNKSSKQQLQQHPQQQLQHPQQQLQHPQQQQQHMPTRNGIVGNMLSSDAYTFPPPEQRSRTAADSAGRVPSPAWRERERERERERDSQAATESDCGSPTPLIPYESSSSATLVAHHRQSSATRLEPLPPHPHPPSVSGGSPPQSQESSPRLRHPYAVQSQQQQHGHVNMGPKPHHRGDGHHNHAPPPPPPQQHSHHSHQYGAPPPLTTQHSKSGSGGTPVRATFAGHGHGHGQGPAQVQGEPRVSSSSAGHAHWQHSQSHSQPQPSTHSRSFSSSSKSHHSQASDGSSGSSTVEMGHKPSGGAEEATSTSATRSPALGLRSRKNSLALPLPPPVPAAPGVPVSPESAMDEH